MTTLSGLMAQYLATLPQPQQAAHQQELLRFARWLGADQPAELLRAQEVEAYQEYVFANRADSKRALPPLKAFLAFAEGNGLLTTKLSRHVRAARVARTATRRQPRTKNAVGERPATVLTGEGYAALEAELRHLSTVERARIAQALREARADRDIRENAPYDAAKQHQAMVEARIRELEAILATAEVLAEAPRGGRVSIGSTVVLRDLGENEDIRYTLVSTSEANPRLGKLSVASPVGKALLDRVPGDVIEVAAPAGALRYRVEEVQSA